MIIVTGASKGLGHAICARLSQQGKSVIGLARSAVEAPFRTEICDVTSFVALKEMATRLRKEGEPVEGLVNAAGIAAMNLAVMTPESTVQRIIQTNLVGTIFSCQAFSPLMIRRKSGRIINFSTIAVRLGLKGESVYAASKAGVEGFSYSFAREMGDFGITVNCVAPGPIATDLLRGITSQQIKDIVDRQVLPRQCTPSDVCDIVEMLLTPQAGTITGQVLHVGGA